MARPVGLWGSRSGPSGFPLFLLRVNTRGALLRVAGAALPAPLPLGIIIRFISELRLEAVSPGLLPGDRIHFASIEDESQ